MMAPRPDRSGRRAAAVASDGRPRRLDRQQRARRRRRPAAPRGARLRAAAGLTVEVLGLGARRDGPAGADRRATGRVRAASPRGWRWRSTQPWRARGRVLLTLDPDVVPAALLAARLRRRRLVVDVHEDYLALLRRPALGAGRRGRVAAGGRPGRARRGPPAPTCSSSPTSTCRRATRRAGAPRRPQRPGLVATCPQPGRPGSAPRAAVHRRRAPLPRPADDARRSRGRARLGARRRRAGRPRATRPGWTHWLATSPGRGPGPLPRADAAGCGLGSWPAAPGSGCRCSTTRPRSARRCRASCTSTWRRGSRSPRRRCRAPRRSCGPAAAGWWCRTPRPLSATLRGWAERARGARSRPRGRGAMGAARRSPGTSGYDELAGRQRELSRRS